MGRVKCGLFVVLEGPDGVGKSTAAARLARDLGRDGHRVIAEAEPSRLPVGKLIREILVGRISQPSPPVMAKLFAADRRQHAEEVIVPAVERGDVVVCERYLLSTLAYQCVLGDADADWVQTLHVGVPRPDLTIILDAPPGVCTARRRLRDTGVEAYDGDASQERVSAWYASLPSNPMREHVDATQPADVVADTVLRLVTARWRVLRDAE